MVNSAPGAESTSKGIQLMTWRQWSQNRKLLLLLVVAPLVGLLGVSIAEIVPDGRIAYHLLRAEHVGLLDTTQTSTSPLGTTRDHWTECLALSIGLGDPPGSNFISSALTSPSYIACVRLDEQLKKLEATGELPSGTSYLRYWHGYTVITRPAVGILGVAGVRWISYALLVTAVAGFAASVRRHLDAITPLLLVAPALLTTDIIISNLSVAQAIGVSTAWLGGWVTFAAVRQSGEWMTAGLAAGIAGALSAYLDLLTTPSGALALSVTGAALGVCAVNKNVTSRDPSLVRASAAAVIGWMVGMLWMWGSKWVLAAVVVGYHGVLDNIQQQLEFRLFGDHPSANRGPLGGLTKTFEQWWNRPLTPWVGATMIVVLVVYALARRHMPNGETTASIAIIGSTVAGWFLVLNRHTQIHAWLVHRSLPIAFGGICAVIYARARWPGTSRLNSPVSNVLARPPHIE